MRRVRGSRRPFLCTATPVEALARTKLWGTGVSASAVGTHVETFKNNLLGAHHFRYGKTGGIAYRHVSDNYIALFSRFIGCGIYQDFNATAEPALTPRSQTSLAPAV